jgi:hypothetical protein
VSGVYPLRSQPWRTPRQVGVDMPCRRPNARTNAAIYNALLVLSVLALAHPAPAHNSERLREAERQQRQRRASVELAAVIAPIITTKRCHRTLLCRWGSAQTRRRAIAALDAAEECPGQMTDRARYAARVLETQQMHEVPHCPDWELARAFELTNASLGCKQSSAERMPSMCDTAHFLTPGMHGVTLVLVTLNAVQAVVAYI